MYIGCAGVENMWLSIWFWMEFSIQMVESFSGNAWVPLCHTSSSLKCQMLVYCHCSLFSIYFFIFLYRDLPFFHLNCVSTVMLETRIIFFYISVVFNVFVCVYVRSVVDAVSLAALNRCGLSIYLHIQNVIGLLFDFALSISVYNQTNMWKKRKKKIQVVPTTTKYAHTLYLSFLCSF